MISEQIPLFDISPPPRDHRESIAWVKGVLGKGEQPKVDRDLRPDHNESAERRQGGRD